MTYDSLNRSEWSRRRGLAVSLGLIDAYECSQLRIRELNPPHVRTSEEIRRECDYYRREACRIRGFPCTDGDLPVDSDSEPFSGTTSSE